MSLAGRMKTLVVDDMDSSRALVTNALRSLGIRNVTTVSNAKDAIDHVANNETHLVLSDYNMPGMDGLSLLEHFRKQPSSRKIGFIVVTGRATPGLVARGQTLKMNNMIRKPFTAAQLRECIERVVGKL